MYRSGSNDESGRAARREQGSRSGGTVNRKKKIGKHQYKREESTWYDEVGNTKGKKKTENKHKRKGAKENMEYVKGM